MRYAEYCQQLEHLKMTVQEVEQVLKTRSINRWAYCIHDKDTLEDGTPKKEHLHVMMAFNSDQTPENIAKWFQDDANRIEKNKYQHHAYENMCSYLVHETPTADGKYHYPDDEVIANFDFHAFMEDIRNSVEQKKQQKVDKNKIEQTLVKIANNEIPRIKIDDHLTELEQIRFGKQIEEAYKIRDRRQSRRTDRTMNCIYISGESGKGKTTYAKMLARQFGYDVHISGSSNDPLQGYIGQECIILDDLRASDWKINDLLKLLDNNTSSMVKSRYSNKYMNDCKLIIITSVKPIESMYESLQEHETEPIEQFKRRCGLYFIMHDDKIECFVYDNDKHNYVKQNDMPNPIKVMRFISQNQDMFNTVLQMTNDIMSEESDPVLSEFRKIEGTLS